MEKIIKDNIDYEFINDEAILGTWEFRDFVSNINIFSDSKNFWFGEQQLINKIHFFENGTLDIEISVGYFNSEPIRWTKNHVINKEEYTNSYYIIKNINGIDYLFLEWKNGDYFYKGLNPYFYVLKKVGDLNE